MAKHARHAGARRRISSQQRTAIAIAVVVLVSLVVQGWTVGPLARGYVEGARGVPLTRWAPTVEQGLAGLRSVLQPGDCVLVKGSRGMRMERVVDALVARLAR